MNCTFPAISRDNSLLDALPEVFYGISVGQSYSISKVSRQCYRVLGYHPNEIISLHGEFCKTLIHSDDLKNVEKVKKESIGKDGLHTLQYRMFCKNGEIKNVKDQWITYSKPDNHWIMEGKISEAAELSIRGRLLQQLKAYRDAVDVNLISSITDRTGKILYVNENFSKISKFSSRELMGSNHRIIRSGHHSKEFFSELWSTINAGKLWHGEILNRAKDGTLYWVDTVIIPIFDEHKQIDKYLSLRMVITDRKKSEQQRQQSTKLLEKIAFMVAHEIRGPLCSILGLAHLLTHHKSTSHQTQLALKHMHESANRLHEITKKLSEFVFENEIELKAYTLAEEIEKLDKK